MREGTETLPYRFCLSWFAIVGVGFHARPYYSMRHRHHNASLMQFMMHKRQFMPTAIHGKANSFIYAILFTIHCNLHLKIGFIGGRIINVI